MIEIRVDNYNHEDIKRLHKAICLLDKIDYGLTIDEEDGLLVARLTEQ